MLPLLFLNKAGRSATATLLARAAGGLRSRGAYPGCMAEQQTQGVCDQARQPLIRADFKAHVLEICKIHVKGLLPLNNPRLAKKYTFSTV